MEKLGQAVKAFELVLSGKELGSRTGKWQYWYQGDKKMDLETARRLTIETYNEANSHNL